MMRTKQEALFYEFSLEDHVQQDHLLPSIGRFVDLSSIRTHLAELGCSRISQPAICCGGHLRISLVDIAPSRAFSMHCRAVGRDRRYLPACTAWAGAHDPKRPHQSSPHDSLRGLRCA
jgi:hypothetical protein